MVVAPSSGPQSVRSRLNILRSTCQTAADLVPHSCQGGSAAVEERYRREGCDVYRGKVRDVIIRSGDLIIYHSDRLTAFDRFIAMVPFKGFILCELTKWWFEQARMAGISSHYLEPVSSHAIRTQRLQAVKAEVVVRRYLAGSMMRAYDKGERTYCGATLPDGIGPYGILPSPIITPTTKAAAFEHDENTSPRELIDRGVCSADEWRTIEQQALRVFDWGAAEAARCGWLLADTKYEFGRTPSGTIALMDEIHTPDSSRFWTRATYESRLVAGQPPEMFDKENVRRFLISKGFSGHGDVPVVPAGVLIDLAVTYLDFAERLLGRELLIPGHEDRPA